MNIKKQLFKATSLVEQGHIEEADKILINLQKNKPKNLEILSLRGAILVTLKEYQRAQPILEKVCSKNNNTPDNINNLATTYISLGLNNEAVALLKKTIKKNDNIASYYSNLGVAYFNLKNYLKAKESYGHALALNNNFFEAKFNHAVCLRRLGLLEEALDEFLEINDTNPLLSSIYFHLSEILLLLHATDDAEKVIDTGLSIASSSNIERFHALTTKSLLAWITGRIQLSWQLLQKTASLNIESTQKTKGYTEANAFNICLSKLLTLREEFHYLYSGTPTAPIFFISESHCLSPSEVIIPFNNAQYRILALMIRGCKAYHLGNSQSNEFKSSMIALFNALPDNSIITLAFGEIDCRYDEGIFVAAKKKNIDYRSSLPVFIHSYVTYCLDLASNHNYKVIFSAVPPLSKNFAFILDKDDLELLQSIIVTFNDNLRNCCKIHSVHFLDVYNATCNQHGTRKPEFDLDGTHLHPKVFPIAYTSYLS